MTKPEDVPLPPPWSVVEQEDGDLDVPAEEGSDERVPPYLRIPALPLRHHDSERQLPPPVSGSID